MWWIKVKKTDQILQLRSRGKYGYYSRSRAVTALKSSGILHEEGLLFSDLELVNRLGMTMAEMTIYPVEVGYALRHREGWYWIHPTSRRVWYGRPGDAEGRWRETEKKYALSEGRKARTRPDRAGFDMVQGVANGQTIVLKNWY
jgi:hypothetical protein